MLICFAARICMDTRRRFDGRFRGRLLTPRDLRKTWVLAECSIANSFLQSVRSNKEGMMCLRPKKGHKIVNVQPNNRDHFHRDGFHST